MDELRQLKELCEAMGPGDGPGERLIAGRAELPRLFNFLGLVLEQMEQRIQVLEKRDAGSHDNPLIDLIEQVKKDKDEGKYPVDITPKKYGFETEEDYWRRIRELAGVPPKG